MNQNKASSLEISKQIKIAFFDLDKTITSEDTDYLWSKWRAGKQLKGWFELLKLSSLNKDYKKGKLEINKYINFQKFRFSGKSQEYFKQLSSEFFRECGINFIHTEALELIKIYKKKGIEVIVITAQNELIASNFADFINADKLISNSFIFKNNILAMPVSPYVFEDGKIYYAEQYAKSKKISLNESAFYSDSIHDLPLLQRVGFPFVVNPDIRLKDKAISKKWPIISFSNQ